MMSNISYYDVPTFLKMGISFYERAEFNKAKKYLNKVLEIDKNTFEAHFYLSAVYEILGEIDKAINEFEFLIRLKNDDLELKNFLFKLYIKNENYLKAFRLLREIISKKENKLESYLKLSEILFLKGKFKFTYRLLLSLNENHPDDENVLFKLILITRELEMYSSAIEYGEKLIKLHPENPIYYYFLGSIYEETENYDKVKLYFGLAYDYLENAKKKDNLYKEVYDRVVSFLEEDRM